MKINNADLNVVVDATDMIFYVKIRESKFDGGAGCNLQGEVDVQVVGVVRWIVGGLHFTACASQTIGTGASTEKRY